VKARRHPSWTVNPFTATPHLRQDTLGQMPIMPHTEDQFELERAEAIFNLILTYYDCALSKSEITFTHKTKDYNRVSLLRYTCQYTPSKKTFLAAFFKWVTNESNVEGIISNLANFDDLDVQQKNEIIIKITAFADYLMNNFFLPSKMVNIMNKSNTDLIIFSESFGRNDPQSYIYSFRTKTGKLYTWN
jgi:hypothetical protein